MVVIGLLLGGVLGLGTVVYALAIGPLTQLMLPWFTVDLARARADPSTRDSPSRRGSATASSRPSARVSAAPTPP